jgi:hypothetical protein
MFRRRLTVILSLALVGCLALGLAPVTYAGDAGPQFNDMLRNAARSWSAQRQMEAVEQVLATMQVVGAGLNNPRGLTFGPDGGIYVAEGGVGGDSCYALDPGAPGDLTCIGGTGSVTRIENGVQERIATGLPSLADPFGFAASGPSRISWRPRDAFSVVIGLGADPALRDQLAAAFNPMFGDLGKLARMSPAGSWDFLADVAAYEGAANPDGGLVDSNPYAVYSAQGRKRLVADAGGNSLVEVNHGGQIKTLAVFPDRMVTYPPMFGGGPGPMQSVPTSVTEGPDGAIYVGELTGFPFLAGEARVHRVLPGGRTQVFAGGFTAIHDIAFGPDGSLYVLEIASDLIACEFFGDCNGRLIRLAPDGTRTVVAQDLLFPGGVAVNQAGEVYITLFSVMPGMGMVVRVQ